MTCATSLLGELRSYLLLQGNIDIINEQASNDVDITEDKREHIRRLLVENASKMCVIS